MDWIQALTIIISMIATIVGMTCYLNNKTDNLCKEINSVKSELYKEINSVKSQLSNEINSVKSQLSNEINSVKSQLSNEINSVKMEVLWIKFRLDPNEHPKWNQTDIKEIE